MVTMGWVIGGMVMDEYLVLLFVIAWMDSILLLRNILHSIRQCLCLVLLVRSERIHLSLALRFHIGILVIDCHQ